MNPGCYGEFGQFYRLSPMALLKVATVEGNADHQHGNQKEREQSKDG